MLPGHQRPAAGRGTWACSATIRCKYLIGRGALEATGIGFELQPGDVAVRGNFCTLDAAGKITDRRAGRIPTEESAPLAIKLREVKIPGVEIFVEPVKEHRFVVVFRGDGTGRQRQRHRPAGDRRAAARAAAPTTPAARRRPRSPTSSSRQAREAAGRRDEGQRPDAPRLRRPARICRRYEEVYGLQGRGDRRLSDVQGPGPAGRHGHRRQGPDARRADRRARSRTGTSTTSSSSTSSTPTAPAKTATSTPR